MRCRMNVKIQRISMEILILTSAWSVALRAGAPLELSSLTLKTLPVQAYRLLERGGGRTSASWSWKDRTLDASAGFQVTETRWLHDERNGRLFTYLGQQLDLQARPGSPNRLNLQVTYYTVDRVGPQLIVEGMICVGGEPKAFFVDSLILDPGSSPAGLVDEFMRDLTAFLR